MRIGLVVDSGCDLPKSFIDENGILVLPISIRIGNELFVDDRDPQRIKEFYLRHTLDKNHDAESVPYTVEQIKHLFLDRVVIDFDYALVETVPKSRSPIYAHATEASHAILREYKPIRKKAGVQGPFALRVIDSQTLFAGQGVLAAETVRLIKAGAKVTEIRRRIEELASKATSYGVVPDIYYLRERARKKGDKSVSWLGAFLGTALDIKPILCARADETFPAAKVRGFDNGVMRMFEHAAKCVQRGLLAPIVCVSYAGDVEAIEQLPGYERLAEAARAREVQLLNSPMGLTGGVNIGPGAVSVGFIADWIPFED
jgi:DegV family protein with EDD domain